MTIDEAIVEYKAFHDMVYDDLPYGACVGVLNGVVAVASSEGLNASSLDMYTEQVFIQWMTKATEGFESDAYEDFLVAVQETTPSPGFSESH